MRKNVEQRHETTVRHDLLAASRRSHDGVVRACAESEGRRGVETLQKLLNTKSRPFKKQCMYACTKIHSNTKAHAPAAGWPAVGSAAFCAPFQNSWRGAFEQEARQPSDTHANQHLNTSRNTTIKEHKKSARNSNNKTATEKYTRKQQRAQKCRINMTYEVSEINGSIVLIILRTCDRGTHKF